MALKITGDTLQHGSTTVATLAADAFTMSETANLVAQGALTASNGLCVTGSVRFLSNGTDDAQGPEEIEFTTDEVKVTGSLTVTANVTLANLSEVGTDTDKFLCSDSGVIKYVDGSNLATYIGAVSTSTNNTFTGNNTFSAKLSASNGISVTDGAMAVMTLNDTDGYDLTAGSATISSNVAITGTLNVTGDIVADTTTFKVDSANNRVGIGTATPSTTLDVNGAATITGAAAITGDLTVDTNVFKVDTTNNRVGIGTASPVNKLDVRGEILTRDAVPDIYVDSTVTNTFRGLFLKENNTNKSGILQYGSTHSSEANNLAIKNYASSGSIKFYTDSTDLRFEIKKEVNFVSDINMVENLWVYESSGFNSVNKTKIQAGVISPYRFNSSSGTVTSHMNFVRNNSMVGNIGTNLTTTYYFTNSDYRLKENVKPITDGLSRLMKLKPNKFNFISDKDTFVDGFLAHEAQEIVPESVTGVKDGMKEVGNITDRDGKVIEEKVEKPENLKEGQKWQKTGEEPEYQGIDQAKLVPLLVAAVQELSKKVTAQEKIIKTLQKK